jgi:hypothetical protein
MVLSKNPLTAQQIAKMVGCTVGRVTAHMHTLIGKGHVKKVSKGKDAGFILSPDHE